MTDTDNAAGQPLSSLRLPELKAIASGLGLKGVSTLRKGDLISAIENARSGAAKNAPAAAAPSTQDTDASAQTEQQAPRRRRRVTTSATNVAPQTEQTPESAASASSPEQGQSEKRASRSEKPAESRDSDEAGSDANEADKSDSHDNDGRYESRSAARRARRNRQKGNQRDNNRGGDNSGDAENTANQNGQSGEQADQGEKPEKTDSHEQPSKGQGDRPERRDRNDRSDSRGDNRGENRGDNGGENNGDKDKDRHQNRNQDRSEGDNRRRDGRDNRGNRDNGDDGEGRRGRRGRRNRRGRDRDNRDNRDGGQQQDDSRDTAELQDVAGILDIVDNNVAFVRTTGYHAAPSDVFVNNQLIRRFGLRRGDAITGKVRMNAGGGQGGHGGHGGHGGRNRQKYNNLTHVETVNGAPTEEARNRPEFGKLTPLYPNQRLRLETESKILTTRVIDLIMPIGKGQRALIVSPPKAGKTTILQNIANAITTNNPECYLMVVLVDERPEEVTDMQRSVRGEVIASTFDRPPSEHTTVAELAIERAKRLVEQGQDVVVLLDSITRLGRAYNNSSPASGRILSGGVDSNALYPPKRFLGAARNIENGGSLTIIATAMVETGSAGDTVIFEEFKGTGNAELKLDRKISERRVFPAVDVNPSGTRKDELLLAPDEARVMHKLRRILSALDNQQAIDLLIKQLKKTKSNAEFLMQVASSAPMAATENEEEYS